MNQVFYVDLLSNIPTPSIMIIKTNNISAKLLSVLLALLVNATLSPVMAASISDNVSYLRLLTSSIKNFNYSGTVPEEHILQLCAEVEVLAREEQDYDNLFKVQLIAVHSYCLKGDIGLAVNKAQTMYDEAKKLKSKLGMALSVQAIADTYMRSGENKQAAAAFAEAEAMLTKLNDDYSKVRLLMQQIHVSMNLNDINSMQKYLLDVRKLLDRIEIPNKKDYIFYLQCYQTLYYLSIKDAESARISFEQVSSSGMRSNRWYYDLLTRYYKLTGDYHNALSYCDSTSAEIQQSQNFNEYKYVLSEKANLTELSGNTKEACVIYEDLKLLTDSLNQVSYSSQIDSLHVNYWIDQMAIENANTLSKRLTWILVFAVLLLIIVVMLIWIARKRNRQLLLSRQKLEALHHEASDSIQSKSLFLSNMSHELRTPLNAIVGFVNLLTEDQVDSDELRQQCGELIQQNADLLLKLFNDVADLSALNGNKIQFTFGQYDAVALCRGVIETVDKVKRTDAVLSFKTSLNSLSLYSDNGRLQQVLINLLVNATKFTTSGTITLRLSVDPTQHEAVFTVEDTGCGIPLQKQPTIFQRFEKLHEGVQGAGLGLCISQLIVEYFGGRIWIDPEYTVGARFVFTHPLNNKPDEPTI